MAKESVELPIGYTWKELPTVNALFPMPESWFFREDNAPGTHAFFMTRERIIGNTFIANFGQVAMKTTNPEGYFQTGLSVNIFPNISKSTKTKPSFIARDLIKGTNLLIPNSQISQMEDGPLTIYRRFFRSIATGPIRYYIEFTGNDRTDTAYVIMFETPSEKWAADEQIARIMVENRILDKDF